MSCTHYVREKLNYAQPFNKLQGPSCSKSSLTKKSAQFETPTLCNSKTNILMKYMFANQMASPEGTEIFLKKK